MPTHQELPAFRRAYRRLAAKQRKAFRESVALFVEGLRDGGSPDSSLRVHRLKGTDGIWSLSWGSDGDGRVTFQHGESLTEGDAHVIWRQVGAHKIYRRP